MRQYPPRPPFYLREVGDSISALPPFGGDSLWIWTSDWHVVSNDAESGIIGETHPTDAADVAAHIASLDPAGVIDTGDCKDHFGLAASDEHDRYLAAVAATLPWGTVNAGVNATYPILPGNHDEVFDSIDSGTVTDMTTWDAKFWGAPYHWTCDWAEPRVRFIALHCTIIHQPTVGSGLFAIAQSEIDYLSAQLAALAVGWQAIVCTHTSADPIFGNNIYGPAGGDALLAVISASKTRIACCLSGHRHAPTLTHVLNGTRHISGPGVSYTLGNSYGGWCPIAYDDSARTLTVDFLYGPPHSYTRVAAYDPIVIQLP